MPQDSTAQNQLVARDGHHAKEEGAAESNLWNLTEKEERARIREFWLGLADQERRSLVQLEKVRLPLTGFLLAPCS